MPPSDKRPVPSELYPNIIDPAPFAETLPPIVDSTYPRIRIVKHKNWVIEVKESFFSGWAKVGKFRYLMPFQPYQFTTERRAEIYARWWKYKSLIKPVSETKELL